MEQRSTPPEPQTKIPSSSPTHSRSPSGEQVGGRPVTGVEIKPRSPPAPRRKRSPSPASAARSAAQIEADIEIAKQLAAEYAQEEERRIARLEKEKEDKRRKEQQEEADRRFALQYDAEMNTGRSTTKPAATRSGPAPSATTPYTPPPLFPHTSSSVPSPRPAPKSREARASVAEFLGSGVPGAGKVSTFDADRKIAMEEAKRYEDEMRSREEALRQQAEEDRIRREHEELLKHVQETFNCVICMEDHPIDMVTEMEGCEHRLCREAAKDTIVAKLEEHRFPILCPLCVADPKANPQAGGMTNLLQSMTECLLISFQSFPESRP